MAEEMQVRQALQGQAGVVLAENVWTWQTMRWAGRGVKAQAKVDGYLEVV